MCQNGTCKACRQKQERYEELDASSDNRAQYLIRELTELGTPEALSRAEKQKAGIAPETSLTVSLPKQSKR